VALLLNPDNASSILYFEELQNVAPILGVKLLVVRARNSEELDDAFETMLQERPDSVLVTGESPPQTPHRQDHPTTAKVPPASHVSNTRRCGGGRLLVV